MHLPDAPSMSLNANNPLVAKNMSLAFPSPYTLSSAETWVNMNTALPYQEAFVICERTAPHVVIGGIGLKAGSDVNAHTGEVGYWIGQAYWGKGYMTEVLEGFTRWVFESWNRNGQPLRRIWGCAYSTNPASMRCFEKCGYAREGVMKGHCEKHGEVMDMHLFGLTKLDWEKRMSEVPDN
jgi:ribosomal-protein-alanine N-acetyltransferase